VKSISFSPASFALVDWKSGSSDLSSAVEIHATGARGFSFVNSSQKSFQSYHDEFNVLTFVESIGFNCGVFWPPKNAGKNH